MLISVGANKSSKGKIESIVSIENIVGQGNIVRIGNFIGNITRNGNIVMKRITRKQNQRTKVRLLLSRAIRPMVRPVGRITRLLSLLTRAWSDGIRPMTIGLTVFQALIPTEVSSASS